MDWMQSRRTYVLINLETIKIENETKRENKLLSSWSIKLRTFSFSQSKNKK